MTDQLHLSSAGRTHIGIVRGENQDRLTNFRAPFGEVFITADGMGGARGGSTAAEMVIEGLRKELISLDGTMSCVEALKTAASRVAAQVHARGSGTQPELAGMGSTVVLAVVREAELVVAHIGDSRAYLYRQGHLSRLTRDHSVVQQMVDAGIISEQDAQFHPEAGILSRAIGQTPQVEIEISQPIALQGGDGVLLCSDGLCGYVGETEIATTVERFKAAPEEAVSALIQLALQAGGEDNITVQYFCLGLPPVVQTTVNRVRKPQSAEPVFFRKRNLVVLAIIVAALVIGLLWRARTRTVSIAPPGQNIDRTATGTGKR